MANYKGIDIAWIIWNKYNPDNQIYTGSGYCIHHKNGNHEDNRIENLQKITISEHASLHHKGKYISKETKEKISKSNKGKKHTKEAIEKIRKASTGRKHSEQYKNSIKSKGNPFFGKTHSNESKSKISKSKKGKKISSEVLRRRKVKGYPFTGKTHSKESKAKIAKSKIGSKNPQSKEIIANYKYFKTMNEAGQHLNVHYSTITHRIKRKDSGYCYFKDFLDSFKKDLQNNLNLIF